MPTLVEQMQDCQQNLEKKIDRIARTLYAAAHAVTGDGLERLIKKPWSLMTAQERKENHYRKLVDGILAGVPEPLYYLYEVDQAWWKQQQQGPFGVSYNDKYLLAYPDWRNTKIGQENKMLLGIIAVLAFDVIPYLNTEASCSQMTNRKLSGTT